MVARQKGGHGLHDQLLINGDGITSSTQYGRENAWRSTYHGSGPFFNEDFVRARAGDNNACKVDSRYVAFQGSKGHTRGRGRGVWLFARGSTRMPRLRRKAKSGWYPVSAKTKLLGMTSSVFGRRDGDGIQVDVCDFAVEMGLDLAVLDAIFDVGLDPVLDVPVDAGAAMYERDARTVPPEIQSARWPRSFLPPMTTTSASKYGCGEW